jgi:hypothetical protein
VPAGDTVGEQQVPQPAPEPKAELSDSTINAATQYMLEMTFPDRPRD